MYICHLFIFVYLYRTGEVPKPRKKSTDSKTNTDSNILQLLLEVKLLRFLLKEINAIVRRKRQTEKL